MRDKVDVELVYHSPLRRASETAITAFGGNTSISLIPMQRLQEEDVGIFVGKLWPELTNEELEMWEKFKNDENFKGHNGESGNEINKRALEVMNEIVNDMKSRSIDKAAVISHGGILKRFFQQSLGLKEIHLANCSIHLVEYSPSTNDWKLISKA